MKIAAIALLVLSVVRLAEADVRVTPRVREGRVWLSFGLEDGLTPELRQAVLSGLAVTVTYAAPLFATSHLEANTEYDVRVRARVKSHGSLIVWPWESGLAPTNVNFTFIP